MRESRAKPHGVRDRADFLVSARFARYRLSGLPKPRVAGSSPVVRFTRKPRKSEAFVVSVARRASFPQPTSGPTLSSGLRPCRERVQPLACGLGARFERVGIGALEHRHAGSPEAGDVARRDAGGERPRDARVPQRVRRHALVDPGSVPRPLELAATEVTQVVVASRGSGEAEAGIEPRRELVGCARAT